MDEILQRLLEAVAAYMDIHRELFGDPDELTRGGLMRKPQDEEVLKAINGTIKDFLVDNDLLELEPLFALHLSANGFGPLDVIPALYGLIKLQPYLLLDKLTSSLYVIDSIDDVMEGIIEDADLDVEYNVKIEYIKLMSKGEFKAEKISSMVKKY